MSVQWRTFYIHGSRYEYEDFKKLYKYKEIEDYLISNWDEDIKEKNSLSIIYDGMDGEYVFVGKIIHRSDMYRGFQEVIEVKQPDQLEEANIMIDIENNFQKLPSNDIKAYLFTHYS